MVSVDDDDDCCSDQNYIDVDEPLRQLMNKASD